MNCLSCGAAIPATTPVCNYCGIRNEIDLRGISDYTVQAPESLRNCPCCSIPLRTIDLHIGGTFLIEQCTTCFGLFFDPGELDALLAERVAHVYDINYPRIASLNALAAESEAAIRYVKCPVCTQLMNRESAGPQSGVVLNRCREHGVWLAGSELRRLLEWAKSGGLLLKQKKITEKHERAARRARRPEETDTSFMTFGSRADTVNLTSAALRILKFMGA